jgi:hypothetical protein
VLLGEIPQKGVAGCNNKKGVTLWPCHLQYLKAKRRIMKNSNISPCKKFKKKKKKTLYKDIKNLSRYCNSTKF